MRQAAEDAEAFAAAGATTVQQDVPNKNDSDDAGGEKEQTDPADAEVEAKLTRLAVKDADELEEGEAKGESAKPGSEGHDEDDEDDEGSEEEEEEEDYDGYVPRARDENEDLRTRVLSVLELEELFVRSAPDLSSKHETASHLALPNVDKDFYLH